MSKNKHDAAANHSRQLVCSEETINRSLTRISYEILEKGTKAKRLAVVGIKTCGEFLAKRIVEQLYLIDGKRPEYGVIDITLYRDDVGMSSSFPLLRGSDLPFEVSGTRIILVDDVLYTGRTIRSALDAIIDYGRPHCVELAVLIDRGHRELPIRADYVGKNIPTSQQEKVVVDLKEIGKVDGVYLIKPNDDKSL
jgi:pyrimidine operon attenuation protein / uracil phosphoribosyltransferase